MSALTLQEVVQQARILLRPRMPTQWESCTSLLCSELVVGQASQNPADQSHLCTKQKHPPKPRAHSIPNYNSELFCAILTLIKMRHRPVPGVSGTWQTHTMGPQINTSSSKKALKSPVQILQPSYREQGKKRNHIDFQCNTLKPARDLGLYITC